MQAVRGGSALIALAMLVAVGACSGDDPSSSSKRTTTSGVHAVAAGGVAKAKRVGRQADGSVVTSTGQVLTPAGKQVEFSGRPVAVAIHPNGNTAAFLAGTSLQGGGSPLVTVVDLATAKVLQQFTPPDSTVASYAGLAYSPDGTHLYASSLNALVDASVAADGKLTLARKLLEGEYPTGVALTE